MGLDKIIQKTRQAFQRYTLMARLLFVERGELFAYFYWNYLGPIIIPYLYDSYC